MIAAAGADAGYAEVRKQNICPFDLGKLINHQGKWEKAFFSLLQQKNWNASAHTSKLWKLTTKHLLQHTYYSNIDIKAFASQFLKRTRWGRKYSKEMFVYQVQK